MARYLIDANRPRRLPLWLGADYEFAHDFGPAWSDSRIWRYASTNALTIVSKDADFSHRVLLTASGPSVIHIRVGNLTFAELHRYLSATWAVVCARSTGCRLVQVYRDRIESVE